MPAVSAVGIACPVIDAVSGTAEPFARAKPVAVGFTVIGPSVQTVPVPARVNDGAPLAVNAAFVIAAARSATSVLVENGWPALASAAIAFASAAKSGLARTDASSEPTGVAGANGP